MSKINVTKCDICGKLLEEEDIVVYIPIIQNPITSESYCSTAHNLSDFCSLECCEAAFDKAMLNIWGNGETDGVTK
jgi:hypothetical protein